MSREEYASSNEPSDLGFGDNLSKIQLGVEKNRSFLNEPSGSFAVSYQQNLKLSQFTNITKS